MFGTSFIVMIASHLVDLIAFLGTPSREQLEHGISGVRIASRFIPQETPSACRAHVP